MDTEAQAAKGETTSDEWLIEENLEKYKLLMFRVYEKKIAEARKTFARNGIEPILIKGWAAARNYDEPHSRSLGDIDLAVEPSLYNRAKALQSAEESLGNVDLHRGLRQLDTAPWKALFENSRTVECGGEPIRILSPADHLRVLCTHWLTDGGIYREKLLDIFYALENRPNDFDWDKFLNPVSEKRRKWLLCTIAVTHRYFGLNIKDAPFDLDSIKIPGWFIETLEREWAGDVKFKYLEATLGDKREFFRQIRKRLPPNPIQSTVNMEGDFDDKPRIIYQIPDMFYRLLPSLQRFSNSFRQGRKRN